MPANTSPLSAAAEEEKKQDAVIDVDQDDPVTRLSDLINIPTRLEQLMRGVTVATSVGTPILVVNGINIFLKMQERSLDALNQNFYYSYTMPDPIRVSASYDAATVSAEAFAFTTTLVVLVIIPASLYAIIHQGKQYYIKRNEINELIRILEARGIRDANRLRLREIPRAKLNELIAILKEPSATLADIRRVSRIDPSTWQRYAEEIRWYSRELSRYTPAILLLASIPGLYLMREAIVNLQEQNQINCSTSPFLSVVMDGCDVASQYDIMSLLIYPWICMSGTGLSFYSAGMVSRFLLSRFSNARNFIYEKFHKHVKEWCEDEDRWLYPELTWRIVSIVALPTVVTYALVRATALINEFARQTNCPDMANIVLSIFNQEDRKNTLCPTAQMSMGVSGLLGDAEFGKIYTLTLLTQMGSFLLGAIGARCFKDLNTEAAREKAKRILKFLESINDSSSKAAFVGLIIAGIVSFFPSIHASNQVLQEGFRVAFQLDGFNIPDPAEILNEFQDKITFINNNTVLITVTDACAQYNPYSIYFRNLLGLAIDCDPILTARSIAAFVSPYWLGVSFTSSGVYFLTSTLLLLSNMCTTLLRRGNDYSQVANAEVLEDGELIPDPPQQAHQPVQQQQAQQPVQQQAQQPIQQQQAQPIDDDSPAPPSGCWARLFSRFRSQPAAPNPAPVQANLSSGIAPGRSS